MDDLLFKQYCSDYQEFRKLKRLDDDIEPNFRNAYSPIQFDDICEEMDFIQLEATVSPRFWRNRIVAFSPKSVAVITSRKHSDGYYLFKAQSTNWNDVIELEFRRKTNWLLAFAAVTLFSASLIGLVWFILDSLNRGALFRFELLQALALCVAGLVAGSQLAPKSRRNEVVVQTPGRKLLLSSSQRDRKTYSWVFDLLRKLADERRIRTVGFEKIATSSNRIS